MVRWRGLSETSPRHVCDRCDRLRRPGLRLPGSVHASAPGQVVVLYPDEAHDGRAGTDEGFGYRIVYVEPFLLTDAVRTLRGRPYPLPFVSEPVSTNAMLSRAIDAAFRAPLEP